MCSPVSERPPRVLHNRSVVSPESGYAQTTDGIYLAYQVVGDGPIDVVFQPDWPGNIDMEWEFPSSRMFMEGIAEFARLIAHDHRGVGLSSRNVPIPNLETRVADVLTVLDAVGSSRPILSGVLASGAVNALLAATRPDRVASLVWLDPIGRTAWAPDNPRGRSPAQLARENENLVLWGTSAYGRAFKEEEAEIGNAIPEADAAIFAKATRNACTPDVAKELQRMWEETDVRAVLPTIGVPTLCLSQRGIGDAVGAKETAALIPGAQFREIPGEPWTAPTIAALVDEIRRFAGVDRPPVELDTVLATALFTDIVDSTEAQARLGDHAWKTLIERHHAVVRASLERWRGVENDTAGDGFYATFDGPARAIRCAMEVVNRVRDLGIEVRSGVHTGECEVIDGKLGGITVSTGARVAAHATASEILVTQTVKDLVAGSRLSFADAGERQLKGLPGTWRLFSAAADAI